MEYTVFYECDKNKCFVKKYRDEQTHKIICGPCKLTSDPNHAKNEESVRIFEEFFKRFAIRAEFHSDDGEHFHSEFIFSERIEEESDG